jgi:uncharacterized protein YlxP (DUF503 family)
VVVGVLQLELIIHGPQSLKQKRAVVKSLLGRCRARFPVSCTESGYHDLWQRAALGIAVVEKNEASADRILQRVILEIERMALADICRQEIELIHYG